MGGHLLVSGMNVYSQYEDCQDAGYYVSDDEITTLIALPIEKVYHEMIMITKVQKYFLLKFFSHSFQARRLIPILACKDRTLKILSNAQVHFSVNIDGIPTCLHLMFGDGGDSGSEVLYGTSDGKLGLISIQRCGVVIHCSCQSIRCRSQFDNYFLIKQC